METGGRYYGDMDRLVALRKGLGTWSSWVLRYINSPLTRVFFLSVSPTHYKYVPLSLNLKMNYSTTKLS